MLLSKFINLQFIFLITFAKATLFLNYPTLAQTTPKSRLVRSRIQQEIINNKVMNWGLRQNSSPVSYQDKNGQWQGFCTNLLDLLDKYLKENKFIENDVNIVRYPISIQDRFKNTRYPYENDLRLVGECGSDSIRYDVPGIKFANSFYITKTVLLIHESQRSKFLALKNEILSDNNSKPQIGVIKSSITYSRVKSFFNSAYKIEIVPVEGGRANVIDALLKGKIDALASDEIILRSILKDLNSKNTNEKFYIDSELVISLEGYGLVLPSDDEEWIKIINKFFIEKQNDIQKLVKKEIENSPDLAYKNNTNPQKIEFFLIALITISGLTHILVFIYLARRPIPLSSSQLKTHTFSDGYALLIGVGESKAPNLSLPVTVKDVKALHQVLIDPNLCAYPNDTAHIRLLHDEKATRENILAELNWLKDQTRAQPKATVIIYYSGHGWLNNKNNSYYLLQHDIDIAQLESTALSAEDFTNALRQIKCDRLLVIIDSCHAAGMATAKTFSDFEEIPMPKSVIDEIRQGKGRVVFTSCEGEESSWIRPDGTMSIYTYHLIEALKGQGNQKNEKFVKISHLMSYLSKNVPISARSLCKKEQTPYFSFETEDFPIALLKGRSYE